MQVQYIQLTQLHPSYNLYSVLYFNETLSINDLFNV